MKIAIQVVALLVAVLPTQLHATPKVLQLNAERLNALELEAFEPWPDSFVISGVSEHAEKELHRGEFVVSLYEAKPVLLNIRPQDLIPLTHESRTRRDRPVLGCRPSVSHQSGHRFFEERADPLQGRKTALITFPCSVSSTALLMSSKS